MAISNVSEKPLLEKIQDLLELEPKNSDVAFCVGKEKKIVRAVKIILKASSPVLKNELEKWEVAGIRKSDGIPLIPLPNFDPIAFELFVKITSLDAWSLESLKASNLLLNQIMNLLLICRSFEMKKAEKNLKILATIFVQSFGEYTDTSLHFLQLSQTNLKSVLGSDDIGIEELDLLYAAMRKMATTSSTLIKSESEKNEIDDKILIGGSSRIMKVQQMVQQNISRGSRFGKQSTQTKQSHAAPRYTHIPSLRNLGPGFLSPFCWTK